MRLLPSGGALAALALLAACAKPPAPAAAGPDTAAIRTAILAQLSKAEAANTTMDTAAVRTIFAEDATWITSDGASNKGMAEILGAVAKIYAGTDSFKIDSSTLDALVVVNDNEAVTFTTWVYTAKAKGKKAEQRVNPFADIWRKGADGSWRITREINADGVAPAPKAAAKP